jgi:hypothetical protein
MTTTRMSYEETMAWGADQYADIIARLKAEGLPVAEFIQTGGMCAAIEVQLEAEYTLLITDAEDTLSWARAEQAGWWVGMYAPAEDRGEPIACAQDDRNDPEALIRLIDEVMRQGVSELRRTRMVCPPDGFGKR